MKNLNQYITEALDYNPNPNNWPNVKELGQGEYEGVIWGSCFVHNGQKYFSEYGTLSMFPSYCTITVNEDDIQINHTDDRQRPELKTLFN